MKVKDRKKLTAFSSPRLFHFAKWPLRLLFEELPATPAAANNVLETHNTTKRMVVGNMGDMQSRTMAVSQKTSDIRRYALHSASIDVPIVCAKIMVASLPKHSRITVTSIAPVGDADALPTPMPVELLEELFCTTTYLKILLSAQVGGIKEISFVTSYLPKLREKKSFQRSIRQTLGVNPDPG
jgi:hypothetical protein